MVWTKLNPAQRIISSGGTEEASSLEPVSSYRAYYDKLEVVNRGVNMLADDVAAINYVIGDAVTASISKGVKKAKLKKLLNYEPNPFQDVNSFRRNLILDLIIDGNIFLYWDGVHLYHLPAEGVTIHSDKKTYVSKYSFEGEIDYSPEEIIHIKDNSYKTIYRGSSRLKPALRTMARLVSLTDFQDNFFKNGAVPGLVLRTDDRLNERHKDKLLNEWANKYRPASGGRRPVILDAGLKIDAISNVNFKELDFQKSIEENEKIVLKCLGIPPILLDSGNNANIRPNHRLYYLETIIPIVEKINSALTRFFGFEVYEDITYVHALRPELREEAGYYSTLVNGGVISPNEARVDMGREAIDGHDDLRIPANIAGSASDPSVGGRPADDDE